MLLMKRLPTASVCKARPQDQTPAAANLTLKVYTCKRLLESGSDGGVWLPVFSDEWSMLL